MNVVRKAAVGRGVRAQVATRHAVNLTTRVFASLGACACSDESVHSVHTLGVAVRSQAGSPMMGLHCISVVQVGGGIHTFLV